MDNSSENLVSFRTIPYWVGINADQWELWRNSNHIGYVQLAFKIITEAMYDLVLGDADDLESASYFFYGSKEDSLYWLWAGILGIPDGKLPILVEKHRAGHVEQADLEWIRNLCTTMKTI